MSIQTSLSFGMMVLYERKLELFRTIFHKKCVILDELCNVIKRNAMGVLT